MDIVTIDFETYYDKEFSLSKMTIEQYIRDPRFEIIGVGVKVNDYPTDWYCGSNPGKFLKSLDYSKRAILCHNAVFDGAILSWLFGIRPKLWLDTLSMARPLCDVRSLAKLAEHFKIGQKRTEVVSALGKRRVDFTTEELNRYGEYCINDVELTKKLWDKLKTNFSVTELLVIDCAIRMYTEPMIELDSELLEKHLKEIRIRKNELLASIADDRLELQSILMSNNKFAEYLKSLGVEPPVKVSPRTGKQSWAFAKTDKEFTDLLEHPDERVQAVVAARLGVKSTIEETRAENLIEVSKRGRLPILLKYYGAHTGRFSGGDKLNLQNLPSRTNATIRKALKAPDGYVLIACDSSQIEARIVAWIARQDDLVEAFAQARDVYSEFATEVYGRTITKADKVERFVGKTCILGLGYGLGASKLQRILEIGQNGISVKLEPHEVENLVQIYRSKNFKIVQFWRKCDHALKSMIAGGYGYIHDILPYDASGITLPSKFKIRYPELRAEQNEFVYMSNNTLTKIYGGKVTENIVQALAALVIREQMAEISKYFKIVLQVHDEVVICVLEKDVDMAQEKLKVIMSTAPKWAPGLPLACEVGVAKRYGDT